VTVSLTLRYASSRSSIGRHRKMSVMTRGAASVLAVSRLSLRVTGKLDAAPCTILRSLCGCPHSPLKGQAVCSADCCRCVQNPSLNRKQLLGTTWPKAQRSASLACVVDYSVDLQRLPLLPTVAKKSCRFDFVHTAH
jgi:hypothetical protein